MRGFLFVAADRAIYFTLRFTVRAIIWTLSIAAAIVHAASINTRGFDLIAAWIFPCSSKKMPVLTPHPMQ